MLIGYSYFSHLSRPCNANATCYLVVNLTDTLLWQLANRITRDYRDLGLMLGIKGHVINAFEDDNKYRMANIALKVLEKWMNAKEGQDMYTMYNELLEALSSIERNDLVEFIKVGE